MKKECEIVQDLLFGYYDEILKDASKKLVEKHLVECNECKDALKQIEKDVNPEEIKEINYLKKVKNKINRKTIFLIIALILLILVVIFNILVFINYNDKASEMTIILEDNITKEQLNYVEETIKSEFKDIQITYSSREDEFQKYKEKFDDRFLEGYDKNNNPFHAIYYIKTNINDIEQIEKLLQNIDYIKNISTHIADNPYLLFVEKFINK